MPFIYLFVYLPIHSFIHSINQLIYLDFFFRTGFFCVALVVLELTLQTMLASNSQRSAYFCLLSDGTKGVHHHCLVQQAFLQMSAVITKGVAETLEIPVVYDGISKYLLPPFPQ